MSASTAVMLAPEQINGLRSNSLIECVEALLSAPEYGALAMPAVYSAEASTRFGPVYDELAGRHG